MPILLSFFFEWKQLSYVSLVLSAKGLAVPVVGSQAFAVAHHYVDECVLASNRRTAKAISFSLASPPIA